MPKRPGAASADPAPLDQSRLTHLVGYAATRASITLRQVFSRHLGPLDLKVAEFSILMLVASNPQVNQKQLGLALDMSAPNLAVTLDRMVERGWIERVRSTQDRRAVHVHLTRSGAELVQRAEKIASTMEHGALRVLSQAERALLIELLLKVAGSKPVKRVTD
jgi:DNA-binding MarR family transcriptional regulator